MERISNLIKKSAYRDCTCKRCGKTIKAKSIYCKLIIPSQKDGISLHSECYNKLDNGYAIIDGGSDNNSNRCINHLLKITCLTDDIAYYGIKGFTCKQPHGNEKRTTVREITSAFSSGHLVTTALKKGQIVRVVISDKTYEIKSFKEYKALTDLNN